MKLKSIKDNKVVGIEASVLGYDCNLSSRIYIVMNASNATTTSLINETNDHLTQDVIAVLLFSFITCFGTFGNLLVIYVFGYKCKKHRSSHQTLMLLLGIVDFISAITNPFLFIYFITTDYKRWDFGLIGCKTIPITGPVSTHISAGILLIMAISRDRAIVTPHKRQFTISTIYKAVLISVLLSILVFLFYGWHLNLTNGLCSIVVTNVYYYTIPKLTVFLTSDALFFLIFTITSVRISRKLRRLKLGGEVQSKLRIRRSKSLTRLIIAMAVIFMVCVFPRDIFHTVISFSRLIPPKVSETYTTVYVNTILKVLHTANCCTNVILYSVMNETFRREIHLLFSSFTCLRKRYMTETSKSKKHLAESTSLPDTTNQINEHIYQSQTGTTNINNDKELDTSSKLTLFTTETKL